MDEYHRIYIYFVVVVVVVVVVKIIFVIFTYLRVGDIIHSLYLLDK